MEHITDTVKAALEGTTYGKDVAPILEAPQDDNPKVSTLITDPVHCVARHKHHDFQSIVMSLMCGLVGQVPDDTFERSFAHGNRPSAVPLEAPRDEAWRYKEIVVEEHKQGSMFIAMAGWMSMIKMVDESRNNHVYVEKRWKAALTGLGLTDKVCTLSKKDLLLGISGAVNQSRVVREKFIKTFLTLEIDGSLPTDPVRGALIVQIKMVWEYYGMCSYRFMEQVIFADSPILGIEAIAREAVKFKTHYNAHWTLQG